MARNFLKSSLEDATFNILCQILFRCVTFFLNAFVLRHVSQAVVGVMNVRLLLLESTILFLSREAFRRACLSKTTDHNWAQVINLMWLTVPLCQVVSLLFGYIWLYILNPPSVYITEHYTIGVWAICISCMVEMCCEPVFLVAQAFLFIRLKVVLESIMIAIRTVTFTSLIIYRPHDAVLAFSLAQVLAVCVYTAGYYIFFHRYIARLNKKRQLATSNLAAHSKEVEDDFPFESLADFLPSKLPNQPWLDWKLAKLTWSFFKQGILKQLLTEGERYVMTLFSVLTFYEQGVYDVVNNLGSLAARFVFRPIEESSYFYFSQMLRRDVPIQEQNQKHMAESSNVLHQVLRCITSIGLVVLTFGQSYSQLLLFLYGGRGLVAGPGPLLMKSHCLSVLLLAVNGITECFAFATMTTNQLDRVNYLMAILSVAFLTVSWGFTTLLGGVGFILANCCNMAARIAHSVWFIQNKYQGTPYNPLQGLIPGPRFLVTLALAGGITKISEVLLFEWSKVTHLGVGGVCFTLVLTSWAYEERDLVNLAFQRWQQRSEKKQE